MLASSVVLYLRTQPYFASLESILIWSAAGLVPLLLLLAWLIARPRFVSLPEAAVRLEDKLGLHNALTSAQLELAPWPEPVPIPKGGPDDALRWDWPRVTLAPLMAAALLVLPFFLPIRPAEATIPPVNEPTAWEEMEEWLENLREEQIAEEDALREVEEKIESLREQQPEDWFREDSLEATDTLRENLERAMSHFERNLSDTQRTLAPLTSNPEDLSDGQRERLEGKLAEALEGLRGAPMAPSQELREQLKGLDPNALQNLDPAAAEALRQRMRQNAEKLREMLEQAGQGQEWGEDSGESEMALKLLGELGAEGNQPGAGGIQRGPGEAPMFHKDDPDDLKTRNLEGVTNLDPDRAVPTDLLDVRDARPNVSEEPSGPSAGGDISSTGRGGDRVWEDRLLPTEQDVLQRYFD